MDSNEALFRNITTKLGSMSGAELEEKNKTLNEFSDLLEPLIADHKYLKAMELVNFLHRHFDTIADKIPEQSYDFEYQKGAIELLCEAGEDRLAIRLAQNLVSVAAGSSDALDPEDAAARKNYMAQLAFETLAQSAVSPEGILDLAGELMSNLHGQDALKRAAAIIKGMEMGGLSEEHRKAFAGLVLDKEYVSPIINNDPAQKLVDETIAAITGQPDGAKLIAKAIHKLSMEDVGEEAILDFALYPNMTDPLLKAPRDAAAVMRAMMTKGFHSKRVAWYAAAVTEILHPTKGDPMGVISKTFSKNHEYSDAGLLFYKEVKGIWEERLHEDLYLEAALHARRVLNEEPVRGKKNAAILFGWSKQNAKSEKLQRKLGLMAAKNPQLDTTGSYLNEKLLAVAKELGVEVAL